MSQNSLEPIQVGTWIDGRPIYRRVVSYAPMVAESQVIRGLGLPPMILKAAWYATNGVTSTVAPYMSTTGASYLFVGINTDREVTVRSTLNTAGWTLYGIIDYLG